MIYYHLSPRENKEKILKEGLHCDCGHIFLGASAEDAFVLAPVMDAYYAIYSKLKKLYYDSVLALYLNWKLSKKLVTLFEVEIDGLVIHKQQCGCLHDFEKMFSTSFHEKDRIMYEYLTESVPPQRIIGLKDYAVPYLKIDQAPDEMQAKAQMIVEMRHAYLTTEEIRARMLPPFPPEAIPLTMHEYVEN